MKALKTIIIVILVVAVLALTGFCVYKVIDLGNGSGSCAVEPFPPVDDPEPSEPEVVSTYSAYGDPYDTFAEAYEALGGEDGIISVNKDTSVEPGTGITNCTVYIQEGAKLTFSSTIILYENVNFSGFGVLDFVSETASDIEVHGADTMFSGISIANGRVGVQATGVSFQDVNITAVDGGEAFYVNGACGLTIDGGRYSGVFTVQDGAELTITDGMFNGTFAVNGSGSVQISGGSFSTDISEYLAERYSVKFESGMYVVYADNV